MIRSVHGIPPAISPLTYKQGRGEARGSILIRKQEMLAHGQGGRVMDHCLGKLIVVTDNIIVSIPSSLSPVVCLPFQALPSGSRAVPLNVYRKSQKAQGYQSVLEEHSSSPGHVTESIRETYLRPGVNRRRAASLLRAA